MSRFVVVMVMLLAAVPGRALAVEQVEDAERPAPPPVEVATAPTLPAPTLRVDLGLASPIGGLGVVFSRPVARWLGIEGGLGLGFSGLQMSGMAKLRLGGDRWWFTPGLGLSVGLPVGSDEPTFHRGHTGPNGEKRGAAVTMGWVDVDLVGVEYRGPSGFVLQASAGVTGALTEAHYDVADLGSDVGPGTFAPQVRLGLGWVL
jgi:hypothetical protein